MCEQVNATHCQCLKDDMMCDNLMCLHKSKFCDGFDDCGDGSDEPRDCETDCSLALEAYDETKICNNQIRFRQSQIIQCSVYLIELIPVLVIL